MGLKFVNSINYGLYFPTKESEATRKTQNSGVLFFIFFWETQNSGVCVVTEGGASYYGILIDIIELGSSWWRRNHLWYTVD